MQWLSFLFLLHLGTKGFASNKCNNCQCCKGGAARCHFYNSWKDYCLDGCIDGFYGHRCRNVSRTNCTECIDGYYGPFCNECPELNSCKMCKDGFFSGRVHKSRYFPYYYDCRYNCEANCKSCTSDDTCTTCQAGKYGKLCQSNCCLGCQNNQCDMNNGSCTCISNFQGDRCDQCVNGKYGSSCNSGCPHGCANNSCKVNGDCYSCKSDRGFYGPSCQECPENCEDCTSTTHCSDCRSGHWGKTCQLSCPSNCVNSTCRKLYGDCDLPCALPNSGSTAESSNVGAFICVSVGSVTATLLAVGIVITIRRYRRHGNLRRHAQERTHELTDVQQEIVRTIQEPQSIQPTADAVYVNTTSPVYEQLKESNKDSHTYDRIEGTNVN